METNFRREIGDLVVAHFRKDKKLHLLVCDMGFGVLDKVKAEFPARVTNCGIMEQGTVGIAAGLALSGLKPVVYSIVNFLVFRALEQIRNDVVLQGLNVKFIGTGANDYFRPLGPSHCCGEDDIKLMDLVKVDVYDPYSSGEPFAKIVDEWMTSEKASYLRV